MAGEKGVLFTFFESREVSINYIWVCGVVAGFVFTFLVMIGSM